jgi:hypothetical protein
MMRELMERLIWWLAYQPEGMDIPVPRELAVRVLAEWGTPRHRASPRPADAEGTSPEASLPGG